MKSESGQSSKWMLLLVLILGGCASVDGDDQRNVKRLPGMEAIYDDARVIVDGWLDEAIWKDATLYPLYRAKDQAGSEPEASELGSVRLVWDDQYLYIAVELEDSDIVAEGESDQLQHSKLGDMFEIFLKPDSETWYWQLQVTPHSRMSSFWVPGRGRLGLPSNMQYSSGLRVAAKIEGTLNNWRDADQGWTAEMAMPLRELTSRGETFGPGAAWRILAVRYNYSRYQRQQAPILTMTPRLPDNNLHRLEEYAPLQVTR